MKIKLRLIKSQFNLKQKKISLMETYKFSIKQILVGLKDTKVETYTYSL